MGMVVFKVLFVIALFVGILLFVPWLIRLALGVVLPAFGLAVPAYWVVFAGWFLLCAVGRALRTG